MGIRVNRRSICLLSDVVYSEDMETAMETSKFFEVGKSAYERGDASSAPALNAEVMEALEGLEVGQGAVEIMSEFGRGWDAAADKAAAKVLAS